MSAWILWAVMLLAQNASFTWVSRARNSSSVAYHAVASLASNGVWFVCLGLAVDKLNDAKSSPALFAFTAAFYVVFTVLGSVGMHHFLMTKVEKGKRKVGA